MVGTGCVLNAFATSTEYLIFTYTLMSGKMLFTFVISYVVKVDKYSGCQRMV